VGTVSGAVVLDDSLCGFLSSGMLDRLVIEVLESSKFSPPVLKLYVYEIVL